LRHARRFGSNNGIGIKKASRAFRPACFLTPKNHKKSIFYSLMILYWQLVPSSKPMSSTLAPGFPARYWAAILATSIGVKWNCEIALSDPAYMASKSSSSTLAPDFKRSKIMVKKDCRLGCLCAKKSSIHTNAKVKLARHFLKNGLKSNYYIDLAWALPMILPFLSPDYGILTRRCFTSLTYL